ncbi:MAG TPA: PKD domain-containing protein [Chitinophagales bacterium]|nr:PKD domain-containing protein [Chitinophagales bacterium]
MSSSLAGCSVSISESVQVKSPYSISGPDLVCPGSQVTYTASGGMHNWSVTGNAGIAGGGTNSGNVSILAGTGLGGYTVTATPVNPTLYCNAPQSISATLAEQPAPPQLIDLGYICPGNVYTHQIASPAAGVSYAWNVVGGTPATGSGTSLSILWNVGSPAYSVSITAQNNTAPFCTASSNTAILPLTQIAIVGDEDICAGERAYYTAAPYMPDLTYTWTITPSLAGSVISGQGTYGAEVQWNNNYPSATLTVSACNLSITMPITIHQPPTPTIVPSGYLCEGSNITLSVSPPGFSQYEWQNGSTNNAMSIVNGGNYLVTVTDVYGCVGNTVINIHQYPQPAAHLYSSTGNLVCIENPVDKNIGVASGIGYTYEWFLNGSPFAGNVNPITHTATAAPGSFNYRAVVTSEYGCQKTSPILTIVQDSCIGGGGGGGGLCNLLPGNYLGFTSNATYCNTLNFQNTSSGATNYVWNFGDGSPLISTPTTNAQTHTYAEPGYYLVALQGTFPSATPPPSVCTRTEYQYVHVPLKADFEFMFACVNLATQFINKTTYTYNTSITSWSWDFGDGSTATDVNPAHVFPAPGNYTVTLTVTTATCIDVVTKTVAIVQLPDVSFAITSPVCEGTASTFTPAPNPDAINWLWDFGNGASVFAQQPEQSYLQNGDYTVQLTVTNNTGCTNTGSQTISVLPVGSGNIVPSSLSACIGQSITLTPPAGSSYLWTNGSTDNPLLAAQSGSYAVTVTQANGCTFKTPPHTLNFTPIPPANITPPATPLNLCPGTNLQLSANAGTNYAYAWSTGQSTSAISIPFSNVPASGLSVTVTVTDAQSGCMNTSTTIQVNPVSLSPPSISPSTAATLHLCQGETAILTATHPTLSNFSWSTGATGNAITVSATGNYTVVVADANGCTSSANKVVLVNDGGNMDAIPVGCYDYCELQPISIPNVYAGYQWLLNGIPIPGATGNQFVPPQTGDYQLQITTPLGCQDTSDVLSLNLIDCLACMATASFTHTLNCSDIQFYATGSGGNGVLSYNWDFGDGNTDTVPNPSHTFAASGTYTICLTVSNLALDGEICTDTLCFNITNYGDDNLNIITDNLTDANCGEADGSISLTIAGSNPPYIIQWSDLNTNEDRINLPAGTYTLTVADMGGCTATQSFTLVELPLAASPLVCSTTTQTELTVSWTDVAAAVGYELVLSGNSPINLPPGTTQYTFTGLQPNTDYTITLEVIAPAACTGSPPTQVTCTTQPDPCATNAPTATAQATNALCGTNTGGINITISGGTPPFAFEWSNLSNDQNLTDLIGGTYTLTITDALACTGTASAVVGEYMPLPELSCLSTSDTEILLTWEPVNGALGYELLINFGSPNNFPPDYTQFTYPNLMPDTQYSFSLSVEQSGNCAASDFVVVTCTTASPACQADNAEALIDADITMVQPAEPVTLSVSTGGLSGALTYLWAADGLPLLCTDSICVFLPDMTTTYSVTVTDIYGCTASAEITIDVRMPNKVIAPNAFTPNGDAINSTFRLVGYNVANLQFSVWDNWGRKVYDSGTTTDLSLGWDGKYKGKDCNIGVYVFKALVRYTDNSEEWLQGNITLIR